MKTLTLLFTGTMLSAGLAVAPAHAQSSTGASPVEQVEGQPPAEGDEGVQAGEPVETAPANAPDQQPAFAGQTRAPQPAEMPDVAVETVAEGLPQLWAMEFLPDGRMLVTAKEGDFHVVSREGEAGPALSGMIEVASAGQGGLLDVALAPDFETSNRIFFSFSEPRDGGNGTSVGRATLNLDDNGGGSLEDVEVIFRQMPTYDGDKHFGSRLVFSPEGHLYVTVGERSDTPIRDEAQSLVSGLGKVFRIDPETGEAVSDNPFVDHAKIQPEIWSWGHRNLQSATLDAEGRLWTVEHGPRGGDELNRPEAGVNYGWPAITYGIAYSGEKIGPGRTSQEGMEQPVYYWDPVIGPSGMALYAGEEFPGWQDAFLVGGLVTTGLVVVHLDEAGERVAFEERVPLDARIRDVRVGPDGAVYAVTEDPDADSSAILRLTSEQ
ncbi:PQQ-dependent sugar dehydrogenase [Aurantimonas sp. HBX-1]|uniref:PQQ-dependent sugar dehydrogenase n=1 Tax=Aurantimonas sp. HBX-1 TaxID=2906072 RepID=UPI001F18BC37|nr:PQQ-dependent sugar dehydrogenase [Aurantimonas sp. HBX-1]UIJ71818.1 PQQ-dependent sugar dehydrogenase [Aurantimonas sp. HBX-1]